MRMITLSLWTTYSFPEEYYASLPHPSKSQGVGTDDAVPIMLLSKSIRRT